MKYKQHIGIGITVYLFALIPISAWILYRQGMPVSELWQNRWNILSQFWWEVLICFALCLIGAMMPDIDIKSISQKVIYVIIVVVDVILILFRYDRQAAILGLIAMLPMLTSHRGPLHSVLAAIVLPAPVLFIPIMITGNLSYRSLGISYYIAFLFGYVSHLFADREGN